MTMCFPKYDFHWDEIGHFRLDQYILMHSVLYRTEMLKLCQLKLPKHTFMLIIFTCIIRFRMYAPFIT